MRPTAPRSLPGGAADAHSRIVRVIADMCPPPLCAV
jgi:hypothetical protein